MLLHISHWPSQGPENSKFLFLHGMGGTGSLWRPIAAQLETSFSILAPDQRGHGKSVVKNLEAEGFAPLDYARDVLETLQHLKWGPSIVVGHSMGVRTACALSHLSAAHCLGLVLIDLNLEGSAGGGLGQTLYEFLQKLPDSYPSREQARKDMLKTCPDPSIVQYLLAVSLRKEDSEEIYFPFQKAALLKTIEQARLSNLRDWIKQAANKNIPVLLLRGGESLVWSKDEFENDRRRLAHPQLKWVEISGTGHGLPFEKRKTFIETVLDWAREKKLVR